jgi:DNA-binding beta-propeller fold protein YncE
MAIWQGYGVRAWPTLMFLDPHGRVFARHEGEFALEPMRDMLTAAIAGFDATGDIERTPLPKTLLPQPQGTLRFPGKVLADEAGHLLFVADSGHNQIVIADLDGTITRTIGSGEAGLRDGDATAARFNHPQGLALDSAGQILYVADTENHAIRAVDLASWQVRTVAGTGEQATQRLGGPARQTALSSPWDLTFADPPSSALWIAMAGWHQLWTLHLEEGTIGPVAGTGTESIHDGALAEATFAQPSGITALAGQFFTADSETSAVRRVDPAADRVRRLVGRGLFDFGDRDGTGDTVRLQHPLGVAAAAADGVPVIYIADTYNHKIKCLDPATRSVETLSGTVAGKSDGDPTAAQFWEPSGLSLAGRHLYIADTNNHAIRLLDLDTMCVSTLIE